MQIIVVLVRCGLLFIYMRINENEMIKLFRKHLVVLQSPDTIGLRGY